MWHWRGGGSLRRHFEHMHAFGKTPSIMSPSPLSPGWVRSKVMAHLVRPDTPKVPFLDSDMGLHRRRGFASAL